MEKYSKTKLKLKSKVPVIITVLIIFIIFCAIFITYITVKNNIVYQKVDESAKYVDDDTATTSTPILINNLVIGALKDKIWVSSERYYFKSNKKANTDIDVYTKTGKAGKFSITDIKKSNDSAIPYADISWQDKSDEYFAIASNGGNNMQIPAISQDPTDEDKKLCFKALGKYRLLNDTIKIQSVDGVYISSNLSGKLICLTSKSKTIFGVYSAVVFVDNQGVAKLVKYNYIKNVKKAQNWPVYAFGFCADLNSDGKNELILQETTQNTSQYDVLEYRDDSFYQVLSANFNVKGN